MIPELYLPRLMVEQVAISFLSFAVLNLLNFGWCSAWIYMHAPQHMAEDLEIAGFDSESNVEAQVNVPAKTEVVVVEGEEVGLHDDGAGAKSS